MAKKKDEKNAEPEGKKKGQKDEKPVAEVDKGKKAKGKPDAPPPDEDSKKKPKPKAEKKGGGDPETESKKKAKKKGGPDPDTDSRKKAKKKGGADPDTDSKKKAKKKGGPDPDTESKKKGKKKDDKKKPQEQTEDDTQKKRKHKDDKKKAEEQPKEDPKKKPKMEGEKQPEVPPVEPAKKTPKAPEEGEKKPPSDEKQKDKPPAPPQKEQKVNAGEEQNAKPKEQPPGPEVKKSPPKGGEDANQKATDEKVPADKLAGKPPQPPAEKPPQPPAEKPPQPPAEKPADKKNVQKLEQSPDKVGDPAKNKIPRQDDAVAVSQMEVVQQIDDKVPEVVKGQVEKELANKEAVRVLKKTIPSQEQVKALKEKTSGAKASLVFDNDVNEGKVENDLEKLMSGVGMISNADPIDVICSDADHFIPKNQKNVCYIVSIVVFDNSKRVLLMQESKEGPRGKWYLPYGRVLQTDDIKTMALKLFEHQTGFKLEITSVVCTETQDLVWFRVSYTGDVVGGSLKTTEDQYSMQAQWYSMDDIMTNNVQLRAKDMKQQILMTEDYYKNPPIERVLPTIPVPNPHNCMAVRHVIMAIDRERKMRVITSVKGPRHLPLVQFGPSQTTYDKLLNSLVKDMYGSEGAIELRRCGILSIEYSPDSVVGVHDGLFLTMGYILMQAESNDKPLSKKYQWQQLSDVGLVYKLKMCLKNRKFIPILK